MDAATALPWLHWLHHASFRIESAAGVIYLDPYKLKSQVPADYIFVTHEHPDHYSPADLRKISQPSTLLVCPQKISGKARGLRSLAVTPGSAFEASGVRGRAVASYNRRKPMHPKRHGNVGFILDLPEGRLYHAGDTDLIDEMAGPEFQGLRVALLPVGRVFFFRPTMGPAQAAQAVQTMRPEFAVPMHYGSRPGSRKDGAAFQAAVGAKALLLPEEEPL